MFDAHAWGCRDCGVIEQLLPFHNFKEEECSSCNKHMTFLGLVPNVTEKDGVYYLVRGQYCQGPYGSAQEAQQDLWNWYGGRDAKKKERRDSGNRNVNPRSRAGT